MVLQGVVVRNGHEGFLEADEEKVLDLSDGGRKTENRFKQVLKPVKLTRKLGANDILK